LLVSVKLTVKNFDYGIVWCQCQMFSRALGVMQHCLKLTCHSEHDADGGLDSFLVSLTTVLRRSVCSVDWSVRDTVVEFIDKAFLTGSCSLSCSLLALLTGFRKLFLKFQLGGCLVHAPPLQQCH